LDWNLLPKSFSGQGLFHESSNYTSSSNPSAEILCGIFPDVDHIVFLRMAVIPWVADHWTFDNCRVLYE
jgi:hypothetical protein